MPEQTDTMVLAILAMTLLVVVWGFRRALRRPVDNIQEIVGGHADGAYQALARKDVIHPDVADAFEQEVKVPGREIRQKDEERRKQDAGDRSVGFDVDPF